ncbi:MAG: dihydroorotate dehydrogenase [Candidatus Omnitrophica bacterium]|nr:dihydroorotate dehydrogenase [Candidatus Omnitrophota bacterium]MCM8798571.1 dihydroorotate dehydrogenase [Candidatus Omnitrophota bacterium]
MGIDLAVEIGNLKLKTPVLVASGTFGYEDDYVELIKENRLGALVTKTITLKPCQGNSPPRVIETPSGMLNSIGLQNEGVEIFLEKKLPLLSQLQIPIIVSIAGERIEDYGLLAKRLDKVKEISALEINISCPNIESEAECLFAQDFYLTYGVVKAVRESTDKTIIAKLSPNVTDIVSIAQAAFDAGAEALSLVNTFFGMAIDIEKRKSKLGSIYGGLSGPAIKPIALYMVYKVAQAVKLPLIGMGGVVSSQDALEFFMAGATCVAIGTGNFINPRIAREVVKGIEEYLKKNKLTSIKELIGRLGN